MRKIVFILMLGVLLSACGQQSEGIVGNTDEQPPELIVRSNGNEVVAVLGTYFWSYDNGDGTSTDIAADAFGPTEIVKRQSELLKTTLGSVVDLDFASTPTQIRVSIWDNDETVRGIEVDGTTFTTTEKGTIVYEVFATWDEGSAYYPVKIHVK